VANTIGALYIEVTNNDKEKDVTRRISHLIRDNKTEKRRCTRVFNKLVK
jgi:hypothetical protein